MLIYLLDDNDGRHELIEKHLGKSHSILHAFGLDDGLPIITNCQEKIGLALLDHDLGGQRREEDGKEKNGLLFVQELLQLPVTQHPATYIIHSYNPTGALAMKQALEKQDYFVRSIPFSVEMLKRLVIELQVQ